MVRLAGLEPGRLSAPDPKSGASTNFATGATNGDVYKRQAEETSVIAVELRSPEPFRADSTGIVFDLHTVDIYPADGVIV